jgi:hypothetical protein
MQDKIYKQNIYTKIDNWANQIDVVLLEYTWIYFLFCRLSITVHTSGVIQVVTKHDLLGILMKVSFDQL